MLVMCSPLISSSIHEGFMEHVAETSSVLSAGEGKGTHTLSVAELCEKCVLIGGLDQLL